jgi:hypothetical protein
VGPQDEPDDEQDPQPEPPAKTDMTGRDLFAPQAGHLWGFSRHSNASSSSKRAPQARHSCS